MRYYKLALPREDGRKHFFADRCWLGNYGPYGFVDVGEIRDWNNQFFVHASKSSNDGAPDDIVLNMWLWALLIMSPRLQNALCSQSSQSLQFLPIRLRLSTNQEVEGYAIANILQIVAAINTERSKFRVARGEGGQDRITSISELYLREEILKDVHILRLAGYSVPIIVSEEFKSVFDSISGTGAMFLELKPGCRL